MMGLRLCYLCHLCVLLVSSYVCFLVDCSSSSPVLCNPKHSFALLQFKNSTFFCIVSPSNCAVQKLEFWMEGTDCCSWEGVTCDVVGNVIDLDLGCSYICGTIIPTSGLFQLSHLQRLNLAYNNLTGSIPESIGNLTRLEKLILSTNSFTGQLPSSLFKLKQLTHLELSENILTGSIAASLGNLVQLTALKLNSNNFMGQVPSSLKRLDKITYLDLSQNMLAGQFPGILNNLSKLIYLNLAGNNFSGPIEQFKPPNTLQELDMANNKIYGSIPSSIFELVNLTVLDLSSNNLSGTVKFDMLSKLKNLQRLNLSYNNQLSFSSDSNIEYALPNLTTLAFSFCNVSEFPSFLRTLENLQLLDLSNNRIGGPISKSESKGWKSLTSLDLSNNFLTSIDQHAWENIVTLDLHSNMLQGSLVAPPPPTEVFLVSNNNLTGEIPQSFCNLSSLQRLDLSKNYLSGKIPECVGNSSIFMIVVLHLGMNNLQGSIPDRFEIGCPLVSLDLNHNKLEGPLPRTLENCDFLQFLNVGNNNLSDTFPYWLGTLTDLRVLILGSNRFYGHINDSETIFEYCKLRIVDLSQNEFTGILPKTLFESLELNMILDVEDIYGTIQYIGEYYHLYDSVNLTMKGREIEMERIRFIFTFIDLSNNHFQGEIPEAAGKIKSLIVLNLAHNNLTGNIPLSLGNLTALESLDLSSNKLVGRIPMQLQSLTFLEALNLSHNELSGPIPEGGQLTTFESDSFTGNIGLCGKPLSVKCGNGEAPQFPPVSHEEEYSAKGFDWKITMLGYGCGLVIGLSLGYIVFSKGEPLWFVRMFEALRHKMVRRHGQRHRK